MRIASSRTAEARSRHGIGRRCRPRLWEVASGTNPATLKEHTNAVRAVLSHPRGKILRSSSNDETIKQWEVGKDKEGATVQGHEASVTCLALDRDSKILTSGSEDETVRVWDVPEEMQMKK